jgi:hypothetical protein
VADIERRLVKWGKRNAVSKRFHAKDDKEAIANWKLDLNRLLQVFNVRSTTLVKNVANFPAQRELGTNRNVTASTIRHGVVNTDAIASYVRNDVANTPTIVSDTHRNALKSSEDTRGQDLRVSAVRPLPVIK